MTISHSADLIVVGAGLYGCTIAQQAAESGFNVLLIDRRSHIAGNAFSYTDVDTGIEVHKYGPHIYHTSNVEVHNFLTRFTEWVPYDHRPWAISKGCVYPLPINLATICLYLGKHVTPSEARSWVDQTASEIVTANNLEDKAISLIGRPLYEAFIEGYTKKQWQTNPRDLPSSVITRLPVRFTYDNRYFNDSIQCMPTQGYTQLCERMVASCLINVRLRTDWRDLKQGVGKTPVVYTGPIDEYFAFNAGQLGWRTLNFELERHESDFQGCTTINYCDETIPWTRITEFRHLYPDRQYGKKTIIMKEFSRRATTSDEPYYPINTQADKKILESYTRQAKMEQNVVFGGRLASYKYLDMHQAVGSALKTFHLEVKPLVEQHLRRSC